MTAFSLVAITTIRRNIVPQYSWQKMESVYSPEKLVTTYHTRRFQKTRMQIAVRQQLLTYSLALWFSSEPSSSLRQILSIISHLPTTYSNSALVNYSLHPQPSQSWSSHFYCAFWLTLKQFLIHPYLIHSSIMH
jgi:hypothetical protein